MKFASLMDTSHQRVITIDADMLVLRLECDAVTTQIRVKPFMASILYALFRVHPLPLAYKKIVDILKEHGLVVSDLTRMHRKLSEIRRLMEQLHLGLGESLLNTRGVGYSLPLQFKHLSQLEKTKQVSSFANPILNQTVQDLSVLISDAIGMTAKCKVLKHPQGYVVDRDIVREVIIEKIARFRECEEIILKEIRTHEADFAGLRIACLLAKLKTYVGLARISEYPISEMQWLDWFEQEVWVLFEDLKKLIRFVENI